MISLQFNVNRLLLETGRTILKCIWRRQGFGIDKAILEKWDKAGALTLPDFKGSYKIIEIMTVW